MSSLARHHVVLGAQWGDEGKGKIVDLYSQKADVIVRFQGGNNAGHTLVVSGEKTILHLIPSGVLHPGKLCFLGNGVVLDPEVLHHEMDVLTQRGVLGRAESSRILVSDRAHVIFPFHKILDQLREQASGSGRIGTTNRGIGPCYEDKASRRGIRVGDLLDSTTLKEKVDRLLLEKNTLLRSLYNHGGFSVEEMMVWAERQIQFLRPLVVDGATWLQQSHDQGKHILFEGAQGALLDLDHGTYPFVTSSHTSIAGVFSGSGANPQWISSVTGIAKAYTTRVGGGPFPTELHDDTGEWIRKKGHEFGSTTGRPRRTGWLDLVALKQACRVSGITALALMKADVLSGLDEVKVCVGYRSGGKPLHALPLSGRDGDSMEPVYQSFKGWGSFPENATSLRDLPKSFQEYVGFIENSIGVPVTTISMGPGREATLFRGEA